MILVDIGNSGVRALKVDSAGVLDLDQVHRLSWPANLNVAGKESPQQIASSNQRWCDSEDSEAFGWLVEKIAPQGGERWLVSTVQHRALKHLETAVQQYDQLASIEVVTYKMLPFPLEVDYPERVGIDRLLASWEGWQLANGEGSSCGTGVSPEVEKQSRARRPSHVENHERRHPVIVAQAGTALTVDIVSRSGVFCGGAILPGLGLSLQLLAAGTASLPWLGNHSVSESPRLPGKNTLDAIAAGVHGSLVGGARFLVERYRSEPDWQDAIVVVTGGDGALLARNLPEPILYREHLVLKGLSRLANTALQVKVTPP